ncbi:MAG: hypothetical protein LBB87_01880 [Nitrososphaerota archaeon]|jgi:hypothetical protein|nr:hypothetical protein [Nitrososphaerota archaeon]
MEKSSKRNLKPLILAVVIVVVVSSVLLTFFVVNFSGIGVNQSSGVFTMKRESHARGSWIFSARSAQGYSTIFCDLSQEDLNKLSIDSRIAEGEMLLILSQGELSHSIDLSDGKMDLNAEDMGVDMFNPGRISMQLKFNNAKDLSVHITWH